MGKDELCQNCSYFFSDTKDYETGFGTCMREGDEYEPYIDEIMEHSSFARCYDLYLKNRFSGERESCPYFEEIKEVEISDPDEISGYLLTEALKHQNPDELLKMLSSPDSEVVKKALDSLSAYIGFGNINAYEGLKNYYIGLPAAETLDDVHIRIKIADALSHGKQKADTIDAYVNELRRTPSNNTTRQLYSKILRLLCRYPSELIRKPLLQLLDEKKYSYRIENRIRDIAYGQF